ncbi:MAG: sigma 54-interacting transcriptional regulator [Gammaproteobacteria bacterium]|nr:sigma 54-interacting transcriptional regulator [Gammaproteobacteria bacterium]
MASPSARQRPSRKNAAVAMFEDQEFRELLTFNAADGRIWLGDKRMVMLEVALFGEMRRELIDALGIDAARRIFTRLGYLSGKSDAEMVRQRWGDRPDRFPHVLPHRFQGMAQVVSVRVQRPSPRELPTSGEWEWRHSAEADAHNNTYGLAGEPACWMSLGYATGYNLELSGRLLIYKEIGCRAMGSENCHIIAAPPEQWDDPAAELKDLDFLLPELKRSTRRKNRPAQEAAALPPLAAAAPGKDEIVGNSPALKAAIRLLDSVAPTDATVLLTGESGVGKELFTRQLHARSRRATQPLVAVNCASIPESLLESELYGVERGAYTGATHARPGRFERADGGTLFLDEIGTLSYAAQAKLLRAIQEGEVERVGGTRAIEINVRIVAATNVDLRAEVARGKFREDLFYRLNVFPIHLPPLRQRREDIPQLVAHFIRTFNAKHGREVTGLTFHAIKALLNYRYPGNIRELENLLERAVILAAGEQIDVSHLFAYGETLNDDLLSFDHSGRLQRHSESPAPPSVPADVATILDQLLETSTDGADPIPLKAIEQHIFQALSARALAQAGGNIAAAARSLGLKRHQLEYRLKSAGGSTSDD